VQSFGKREEVLKRVLRNPTPLKVVAEAQGGGR
jgi:ATP-binding cassette subfamily C protein